MSVSRAENGGKPPVTFQQVFEDELKQIEQSRAARNPDAQQRPERSLIGLAFSGGGIRSACFNLGILQALAENRLLHKFDYLSTVSGGGYIGSWLAAVTRRLMATVPGATFANVEQALAPSKYEPNKRNEPTFLHWLRMYSSYLTPRKGLVSGDTWAAVGTWMRNVFLNQVILGLMFVGAFVLCHAVLLFFVIPETERVANLFFIWIGGGLLFLAAISIAFNVVDLTTITGGPLHWFQRIKVTVTVMVPCFMASVLLNCGLWQRQPDLSGVPAWQWALAGAGFNLLVWGVVTLLVFYRRLRRKHRGKPKQVMISVRSLLIFSLIAGAAGACLLREYTLLLGHLPDFILTSTEWVVVIFGSGAVMLVLLITGALHLGLVGLGSRDLVREWWARTGGYLMLIIIGWLLLAGTCAFGPLLIRWAIFRLSGWQSMTAALLWIAHNYLGAKAAYYAKPSSDKEKTSKGGSEGDCTTELEAENSKTAQAVAFLKSPRILESIAKVAPYVFAAGLILLLSTAVHIGTGWVFDPSETWKLWHSQLSQGPKTAAWLDLSDLYWKIQESTPYRSLFVGGVLWLLAGLVLSWRVDVNEFSLHHFYRNRLVRCYLGASNPHRKPQAFTGFDPADDLPLNDFAGNYPGPYPILNAALNITGGEELGYATRQAKSFVFTPRYCGYELRFAGHGEGRFTRDNGYIPSFSLTAEGRSKEPLAGTKSDGGIGLGTAMAISGAAASPNMGYFSSPATAFFMTLFDVRLGWWMGNPRHQKKWRLPGPGLGITYLFSELLGQSDENKSYVYLSDGGHFENLAVYELIKRHCKMIVACDAGCDAHYQFENLIALMEKARTDFGARIELDFARIRPNSGRESEHNFVVGTIYYDPQDDKDQGKLIYIKASMPKRERKEPRLADDVWHYSDLHKTFPHESTADQWFDELQFESYRALGECIARAAAEDVRRGVRDIL
jgi:hypothetical protein